jgi:hypothetical protein
LEKKKKARRKTKGKWKLERGKLTGRGKIKAKKVHEEYISIYRGRKHIICGEDNTDSF